MRMTRCKGVVGGMELIILSLLAYCICDQSDEIKIRNLMCKPRARLKVG
jgi:hypothetical protein